MSNSGNGNIKIGKLQSFKVKGKVIPVTGREGP
jgi:hypothetical protein